MIVCICRAVSDKHIRRAAAEGVTSLRELSRETGLGTCCGKCVPQAREVLAAAQSSAPVRLADLGMPGLASLGA